MVKDALDRLLTEESSRICFHCRLKKLDEEFRISELTADRFGGSSCNRCRAKNKQRVDTVRGGKLSEDGETWLYGCTDAKHFVTADQLKSPAKCLGCYLREKERVERLKAEVIAAGGIPCHCGERLDANGKCPLHFRRSAIRDARLRQIAADSNGTIQYCSGCRKNKAVELFVVVDGKIMKTCQVCQDERDKKNEKKDEEKPAAANTSAANTAATPDDSGSKKRQEPDTTTAGKAKAAAAEKEKAAAAAAEKEKAAAAAAIDLTQEEMEDAPPMPESQPVEVICLISSSDDEE